MFENSGSLLAHGLFRKKEGIRSKQRIRKSEYGATGIWFLLLSDLVTLVFRMSSRFMRQRGIMKWFLEFWGM